MEFLEYASTDKDSSNAATKARSRFYQMAPRALQDGRGLSRRSRTTSTLIRFSVARANVNVTGSGFSFLSATGALVAELPAAQFLNPSDSGAILPDRERAVYLRQSGFEETAPEMRQKGRN